MKRIIVVTLAIFLLTACSGGKTDQSQSAPSGPTPTPPPFAEILIEVGFHQTRNYCTVSCTSYELYSPQTIAKVFDDGSFSLQVVAGGGGVLDMQAFNQVLTKAYGQEFADWAVENLDASLRKAQTGSLGFYNLSMSGKTKERVTITITRK